MLNGKPVLLNTYLLVVLLFIFSHFVVHCQHSLNFSVVEENSGVIVGKIQAPGNFSLLTVKNYFNISRDGIIRTVQKIDRERESSNIPFILLILLSSSNGFTYYSASIYVEDINDNIPSFNNAKLTRNTPESSQKGRKITLDPATDPDFGNNGTLTYGIVSGNIDQRFQIRYVADTNSLDLIVDKTLDRETVSHYTLNISACDQGVPRLCGFCVVEITVQDVNDNAPIFNPTSYSGNITENSVTGLSILSVNATDIDLGTNAIITFSVDAQFSQYFYFKAHESILRNRFSFDYEEKKEHQIVIEATDSGKLSSIAHVKIYILDVNDNSPQLTITYYNPGGYQVNEGAANDSQVALITVLDRDSGLNAKCDVKLEQGNEYFLLRKKEDNENSYILHVGSEIDRERTPQIQIRVSANDNGFPRRTTGETYTINIGDINDNSPVFGNISYFAQVNESTAGTKSLLQVFASDEDLGSNADITYSIVNNSIYSSWFHIDPTSGNIYGTASIDREKQSSVNITVNARDNGNPIRGTNVQVRFDILDANDNPPMFENTSYSFSIVENTTRTQSIGPVVAKDIDSDMFLPIRYSLQGTGNFYINSLNGEITTSHLFDREKKAVQEFSVIATDLGGLHSSAAVAVTITDINDNEPFFPINVYDISVYENTPVGIPVQYITARDDDIGDNGKIIYKIHSCSPCNAFEINNETGGLSPIVTLDHLLQSVYHLVVSCRDLKGLQGRNRASLVINVLKAIKKVPRFESDQYTFKFNENMIAGSPVGRVFAKRDGVNVEELLEYKFLSDDLSRSFSINYTGGIFSRKIIDFEKEKMFTSVVMVRVFGTNLTATTNVQIIIVDVNDNTPQFNSSHMTVHLNESVPLGFHIFKATAVDFDAGDNGIVSYSLRTQSVHVQIDPNTGILSTKGVIDYEVLKQFTVVIIAEDKGNPKRHSTLSLTVLVVDINDNPPQFPLYVYFKRVAEDAIIGQLIVKLNVTDADSGQNGEYFLSLTGSSHIDKFNLSNDGSVKVAKPLNREAQTDYTFVVVAKDQGHPQHTTEVRLTIIVTDVNDNGPVFGTSSISLSVCEEQSPGTYVKAVTATDDDEGSNGLVSYQFDPPSQFFDIDSVTGIIKTKKKFDRESSAQVYYLFVNATDGGNPSKSSILEVKIDICDTNDNAPVFTQDAPYILSILQSTAPSTGILHVQATDKDQGLAAAIEYNLVAMSNEGESLNKFEIDRNSGWIKTKQSFMTPFKTMYSFSVVAGDKGLPRMVNIQKVIVFILPGNGQPSLFPVNNKTLIIPETTTAGSIVYAAHIAGEHSSHVHNWEYSIASGNTGGHFIINKVNGIVQLSTAVSYRATPSFQLTIHVKDGNRIDTRTGVMYLNIFIQSRNREWPVFEKNPMIHGEMENISPGGVSFVAKAVDNDFGDDGKLLYSIISQGPGTPSFNIDPFTGRITNTAQLDREAVSEWTLIIKAQDTSINATARHSTTATLKLIVFDLNDNSPKFLSRNYTYMMEDERVGYPVMRVVASDADVGGNAKIRYSLRAGNERGKFQIQTSTGEITLKEKLTFNDQSRYSLVIDAIDSGTPALSSTQVLSIDIIDVNDNSPRFTQRIFVGNITENMQIGTKIVQVTAEDLDAGSNAEIVYRLEANSHFQIDSKTGWISTNANIDREEWASYQLSISADNKVWPFHSDTAVVVINVDDVNDCPPVFSDGSLINFTVLENSITVVHRFVASDCDIGTNAQIHYSIVEGNTTKFSLGATSGLLYTASRLDRETAPLYELKVQARNIAPPYLSVQQIAKVFVRDLNDNDPIFTKRVYYGNVSENSPINRSVLHIAANDKDEGSNGKVIYEIVRNKTLVPFEVDLDTGILYVNGLLDYENIKIYQFEVKASDSAPYEKRYSTAVVVVSVTDYNDNAPIFTSPVIEGNATESIIVTATDVDSGLNGQVRYRFTSGSSLFLINSLTGKVSFQNPAAGRYRLSIEAYDLGTPRQSSTTTLIINVGHYSLLIPVFLNKSASARIPENSPENKEVCIMVAKSSSSNIRYAIKSSDDADGVKTSFKIDPITGVVYVNNPMLLDYERKQSFDVVVQASVNGNDTLSTFAKLRINITDVNDNAPEIEPKNDYIRFHEASTGENQSEFFVKQFTATDIDSGDNGNIDELTISGGNEDGVFKMGPYGILVLKKNLDYETKKVYKLELKAKDKGSPPKYKTTRFTVYVIDKNDNPPVFKNEGPKMISEDASPGSLVGIVEATDLDEISRKSISYSLRDDGVSEDYFYLDSVKGSIKLLRKLDYEARKQFKIVVEAKDGRFTSNMTLVINVIDTNDNTPVFIKPGYDVYLPEVVPVNYEIIRLNATDEDSGEFGTVYYSIPYPPIDAFLIDQTSGSITTTKQIVLNARNPPYKLLVFASDGGNPPLQTQTRIHLRVKDPNYLGPKFDPTVYPKLKRIFESIPVKALIETVTVTPQSIQPGNIVEYSLNGGNEDGKFFIDPLTGKIQLAALLDRENISTYSLIVRATDRGTPPQFAEAIVNVVLVDSNDNRPVFEKEEYSVTVKEDIAQNTVLVRVNATDRDDPDPRIGNGLIDRYAITSGNSLNWFEIDSQGIITLIRLLDRESTPVHRLTVTAFDKGQPTLSGDTSVVINLEDVNDNRPEWTIPNIEDLTVLENSENGTRVFKATAEDRDQGLNGLVTYSIIAGDGRDYLRIDNQTGLVTTKGNNLDYEKQTFLVLRIKATDHGSPPQETTQEYRIAVQDVNEFQPQFVRQEYEFSVKGNATNGTKIGTVNATDKDGGSWSKVQYSIDKDELRIGSNTGEIFINADLRIRQEENKSFLITADNGFNTTGHTVPLKLLVDYSCPGCSLDAIGSDGDSWWTGAGLILFTVLGTTIALLMFCFIAFIWRQKRNHRNAGKEGEKEIKQVANEVEEKPNNDHGVDFDQTDNFDGYHPRIFKQPSIGTSSGHGSSGSQLLGEYRRPSFTATDIESTHSFVVYHDNKPVLDSGIVGDFDRLSDVTISDIAPSTDIPYVHKAEVASSVGSSFGRRNEVNSSLSRKLKQSMEYSTQSESHDSLNDFMDEGGGEAAGRIEFGNLLYTKLSEVDADEHEAVMDGTRSFMDEGAPSHGGSLSTIIGSDEETKGIYNRDYLLDWNPQFKPVASVFSEIAQVKRAEGAEVPAPLSVRGNAAPKQSQNDVEMPANVILQSLPSSRQHRGDSETAQSIPMQNLSKNPSLRHVDSLRSKLDSDKPNYNQEMGNTNFLSNRTSMLSSFASLPRSPLSAQSSYTSGPLSPNFTPAITPLITRSPSVSPLETPNVASPMDSKPESVVDVAEKSRRSRRGLRRNDKIALSDRSSEQEYRV